MCDVCVVVAVVVVVGCCSSCVSHNFFNLVTYLQTFPTSSRFAPFLLPRTQVVGTTVDEKPYLVPSAITFLNFLAACLRLGPDDRITAAALLEDESVGQRWFALASGIVDIRCRGVPLFVVSVCVCVRAWMCVLLFFYPLPLRNLPSISATEQPPVLGEGEESECAGCAM